MADNDLRVIVKAKELAVHSFRACVQEIQMKGESPLNE